MSFRRAQLVLILIIFAGAGVVAILVQNQVDTPWILTFVAAVVVVGGFVLHVLSQNTDAVGSIQGWLQPEKTRDKQAVPKLKLTPERQQQVRATLLENVRLSIRDYFQEELHTVLGAYSLPKVYEPRRLRNATYQRPNQPDRSIRPDEPIISLFRQSQNTLLILGDPGAGKTFTLTELARELVAAAADTTLPVPVLLNLSSWSPDAATFLDWLVDQLYLQYLLARNVGRAWVTAGQLTLLLDGLDEIAAGARDACITAINDFRAEYQVDLVVCSRVEEFNQLKTELHLAKAIHIKPLEDEQIQAYLAERGAGLEVVQAIVRNDPILRRLARTPLILNIIALAYGGLRLEQLAPLATIKARRDHLYNTYLRRRLAHHPRTHPIPGNRLSAGSTGWRIAWIAWACRSSTSSVSRPTGCHRRNSAACML